jgi:hypothetical protein
VINDQQTAFRHAIRAHTNAADGIAPAAVGDLTVTTSHDAVAVAVAIAARRSTTIHVPPAAWPRPIRRATERIIDHHDEPPARRYSILIRPAEGIP